MNLMSIIMLMKTVKDPQQFVQNMLSSGQITQEQFEQAKQKASELQNMLKLMS